MGLYLVRVLAATAACAFFTAACTNDYDAFRFGSGTEPDAGTGAGGSGDASLDDGGTTSGGFGGVAAGGSAGMSTGGVSGASGAAGNGASGAGRGDAGRTTCDAMYSAETGYLLCAETGTSCRFVHASSEAKTCTDICEAYDGSCIDSGNGEPESCTMSGDATCDSSLSSAICVCSKP